MEEPIPVQIGHRNEKCHSLEQVVRKLRDGDALLNAEKNFAAGLRALKINEGTYHRWRVE